MRIDDLAALVGVPRATLYYYFSGKDDVFEFLLTQKLQRGTAAIAAAAHGPGDAVRAPHRRPARHVAHHGRAPRTVHPAARPR